MDIEKLVRRLRELPGFPTADVPYEVRETHASVVVLVGDDVYKLKKPVDFGFLDYSTPERRRAMCRAEVELNRRLAPTVYYGVSDLRPFDGEPADRVVHMRRLDDALSLESMVREGRAAAADLERLAEVVATFHREAARGPEADRWGTPEAIAANVRENFAQIEPFLGRALSRALFERLRDESERFLGEKRGLLVDRVREGCIAECHGDLRAEHVYFEPGGISIIDCIEFSERYRCQDVASDVGFLAMDLERLGRRDLAEAFIARYDSLAPYRVHEVLDFYRGYRAIVRGKVACLKSAGSDDPGEAEAALIEAIGYFGLAARFASGEERPLALTMCGLTGTGKSTLATVLGRTLGAEVITADMVRKDLAGVAAGVRVADAPDTGLYSPAMNARVYEEMHRRAGELLREGRNVILDGTYRRRADREAAAGLATKQSARFAVVSCEADEEVIRERLERRWASGTSVSDGRWEVYLAQREGYERPGGAETVITVDTEQPMAAQVLAVADTLSLASFSG